MAEGRKCCVYLPNERKLELNLQSKFVGRDLLDIVAAHFKLKEKEYFGIAYKSDSGHISWLQDEKRILDHSVAKKSNSKLEFQFAVKFYVESVSQLKYSVTIELFFLQVKSLIYKGLFEIESNIVFKLAAYVLQITCSDYTDDETAIQHLRKLPVLPNKVLQDHPAKHCETSVLELYKDLKGKNKGKCILNYMTIVESLPTYGIHFYKVKDKSGIPWWLGLNFKGIFQFDFHDRSVPVKTYHWRQLENLYFREKKFSIEVCERIQRRSSAGSKATLSVEPRKKPAEEVKVYAWYGSIALIKSVWVMSIAQHHYYLDRKQSKSKLKDISSLTDLSNDLNNNNYSLINTRKGTPVMTQKQIKDVDVTVKKGSKDETPEVRAAKREMAQALKERRTELEDKLYDKVQELKKVCLQESEITGKFPPEYVRYMDLNEKPPKIKKRIGAEYKVKLRNKQNNADKDYPTSVTAASSSSSGFGSEVIDLSDELSQLEQEFEILTQIANAAKKLASDRHARGKIRNKRWNSYKQKVDKLQTVEEKINVLRKKSGQQPTVRASMLITDEDDMMFEDGGFSVGGGTESERSSLSEGMLLDDDTSLSSGGEVLSTHSTPAIFNRTPQHVGSAVLSRKNNSACDVDISDIRTKRSQTPPPSFERSKIDSSEPLRIDSHSNQYPLLPSPQSSSGMSIDSTKAESQNTVTRNWICQKWEVPRSRPNRGWQESSLDSISTVSTASRQSEENARLSMAQSLETAVLPEKVDMRLKKPEVNKKPFIDRPPSANSNQNNHNEMVSSKKNGDAFNMTKLKREVSDSALSELSVKSNPAALPNSSSVVERDGKTSEQRRNENLPKIMESPPNEQRRKRSSSFSETPNHHEHLPRRGDFHRNKTGTLKSNYQPQYISPPQLDAYNVQQAFTSRMNADDPHSAITKSKSSQDLQPPIFDTNLNIRMQYSNRSDGYLSYAAPSTNSAVQAQNVPGARHSQPGVIDPGLRFDPNSFRTAYNVPSSIHLTQYYPAPVTPGGYLGAGSPTQPQPTYTDSHGVSGYPPFFYSHPAFNQLYQEPHPSGHMTIAQRDMLNNEVYQDIGMGWVPTFNEYSSRASVCESASAQSKKEDILRVLSDHIAMKRTPSNAGSHQTDKSQHNKQRRLREQYVAFQKQNTQRSQPSSSRDKTWADYQKQPVYSVGELSDRTIPLSQLRSSSVPNDSTRTSLFHHKPPPPPVPAKEPLLYKTQKQPRAPQHKSTASSRTPTQQPSLQRQDPAHHPGRTNTTNYDCYDDSELKKRMLVQHYLHHDHGSHPLDHVHGVKSRFEQQPHELQRQDHFDFQQSVDQRFTPISIAPSKGLKNQTQPQRWISQQVDHNPDQHYSQDTGYSQDQSFLAPPPRNEKVSAGQRKNSNDAETVVIQALTKSPEGHEVSVFTVTKSAPNTPLPKRHGESSFFPQSSDDDESCAYSSKGTIKRQPNDEFQRQSADDLLSATRESLAAAEVASLKVGTTPSIIVHTPSFKSRVPPPAINIESHESYGNPTQLSDPHILKSSRSTSNLTEGLERPRSSMAAPEPPPPPPPRIKQTPSRSKSSEADLNSTSDISNASSIRTMLDQANNRGTPLPSDNHKMRPPPPAYNAKHSTPVLSRKSYWQEMSPQRSPGSSHMVQVHSGTLPRASKSRRKLEGGDMSFSGTNQFASLLPELSSGEPQRERNYKRSKSEAGKPFPRGISQPVCFDGSGRFQGVNEPITKRYHVDQNRTLYSQASSLKSGKLSASAEDLLWTESGDNQAGTLV